MMKPVGKPDAGNLHVRFDERGGETERGLTRHRALPRLYFSLSLILLALVALSFAMPPLRFLAKPKES
jgi:hypothetical protein